MIAHVVLFRPRGDLSPAARAALAGAFEPAMREIPSIRRTRVGKRFVHGRAYETAMQVDYQCDLPAFFGPLNYLENSADRHG